MKSIRIFKWLGLLFGGAMLIGALLLAQHSRSFIARAQHAPGVVVEMVPHSSNNNSTTYAPVVRYNAPDGRELKLYSSTSSNPPAYSVGEQVDVLFLPGAPEQAKINAFFSLWGGAVIVAGIGAVFLLIGLGVFLASRMTRKKEEDLMLHGTPVMADFQEVARNTRLTVNGRNPFRVAAQWLNPATGKVQIFHSQNLWFDPTPYIDRKQLTVFLDTANPNRYYMDVSFLPQEAN